MVRWMLDAKCKMERQRDAKSRLDWTERVEAERYLRNLDITWLSFRLRRPGLRQSRLARDV